ncbi:MAG: restriction endonuclease subunit S [Candidatus Paceibacterota bacterium]|jgi:type I restriction enzyme S subunit
MSEFKKYKLGDLGSFFGGVTSIKKEDYGHGTPFLPYKNVYKNSKVNIKELELMNVRPLDLERRSGIYGDIFFTASSETPDEVAMSSVLLDEVENLTFNGFCKRFRLNDFNTLLPEYARYLFRDISFRNEVYQKATGDIRFNISQESLTNIEIEIPDIETQKEIAGILTSIDDKIELNLQINENLETMSRAIFKEWFIDFNFPEFNGALVNEIPEGWSRIKINDICDVNTGTLNSKDTIKEIHYVEISEVEKGIINNIKIYNRGEEPSRARRKLKHGDCVLSTVRPNRGSYFISLFPNENLIASTGFAVFSPTKVPFSFLYLFLTNPEQLEFYGKMADGAAYPAINQSVIMDMDFLLPSAKILELFHNIVGNALIKCYNNLEENKILAQTRETLLPKLMSNKIEIKN